MGVNDTYIRGDSVLKGDFNFFFFYSVYLTNICGLTKLIKLTDLGVSVQ